jgi:hypothetical protein
LKIIRARAGEELDLGWGVGFVGFEIEVEA